MSGAAAISTQTRPASLSSTRMRDIVALAKPGITVFNLITTGGGLLLAYRGGAASLAQLTPSLILSTLLGTSLVVGGANALNMYIERESDGRMDRTKNRPLPAGRLSPQVALVVGVALSVASVPVFALGVNLLTCLLAVLANLLYVLAYTPLKARSHHALLVGAVPGAIPPLLGWTAATGRVDAAGMVLFGILFIWQVPHFLAIATFRKEDYARAGLVVMTNVATEDAVRQSIVRYTFALVLVSLLLVPLHVAGVGYLAVAVICGVAFQALGLWGLRPASGNKWARQFFAFSLVYLVAMMAALAIGV